MLNKKKGIIIVALVLIIAISSLIFTNFGLYRSETVTNQQMESYSTMNPEINMSQTLYLYVERGEPVSNELENKLKEELQRNSQDIKSFGNLKNDFEGPMLAAKVLKTDIFYTPFYSQADVDVLFFFSLSGNTTYFQKFVKAEFGGESVPVVFYSQEEGNLIVKSKMKVTDTTHGVFSIKAYHSHLAGEITNQIEKNIEKINTKY